MIWPFIKRPSPPLPQREQDLAWLCRASFELGYRANGDADGWRDAWRNSKPRVTLVAMGYIKEEDTYR